MIKLNNKNITYVALADSNNSLKAPKEIWYADSNNSVKLVYRRKDALIEGEDYEKYHFVKGDTSAYIDTLINSSFGDELNATFTFSSKSTISNIPLLVTNDNVNIVGFITGGDFPRSGYPQLLIMNHPVATNGYIEWGSRSMGTTIKDEYYMYMKINNAQMPDTLVKVDGVICNYDSIVGDNLISEVPTTTYKIGKGYKEQTGLDTVKLKNVTISSKINLVPCRLLKPVPKWLDANGIRRQVGECGMIDLVSGKFYGNVNSVGTFTVENYYERKEWLQGRNGAYIDTMHPLTAIDDAMIVHAHYDGVTRNPSGYEQAICGVVEDKNDANKLWAYIYIGTDNNLNTYQRGVYRYSTYGLQTDAVNSLEFTASISNDGNNFTFTKNSNSITVNNPITRKTYGNVYLFNRNTMAQPELVSQRYFQGDIASFQIGNSTFTELSVDMIPCTLTMDLPASMDANNIARTKGTSGMWDLVSDRFYGNVANSGTFKAVNLAEGVDYEVHQYLVTSVDDGATSGNTAYITLPTPILLDNKVLTITMGSLYRDFTINGSIVDERRYIILAYAYSSGNTGIQERYGNDNIIHSITDNLSGTKTITLDFKNKVATVGNNSFNIDGVGYQFRGTNRFSWGSTKTICNITIDNELNLIPVKLLRSIPSKYDANGIARQAGECGMYDTVNDVFYGNVASSGSFTVSDDN